MLSGYIIIKNGYYQNIQFNPQIWHTLWDGWGNNMFKMIIDISLKNPETTYAIVKSDCIHDSDVTVEMKNSNTVFITPCIDENVWPKQLYLLYSPLEINYTKLISPHTGDKIHRIIWRGAKTYSEKWSGTGGPREIIMKLLKDDDRCDVKYTRIKGNVTDECAPTMSIEEQQKYIGILCIDGSGFANILGWALGSGSVPVVYSRYKMGFQYELKPWVHYVPISDDFSDLVINIDWIFSNPEKCKEIVFNALELYKTKLDPEYVKSRGLISSNISGL
jgi:hypothetical protein